MLSFFKKMFAPKQPEQEIFQESKTLYMTIDENIDFITKGLYHSDDIQVQKVTIQNRSAVLIYLETMIDMKQLQQNFLDPLMDEQTPFKILFVKLSETKLLSLHVS